MTWENWKGEILQIYALLQDISPLDLWLWVKMKVYIIHLLIWWTFITSGIESQRKSAIAFENTNWKLFANNFPLKWQQGSVVEKRSRSSHGRGEGDVRTFVTITQEGAQEYLQLCRRGHTDICHDLAPMRETCRTGWIYFIAGDIARCLSYFARLDLFDSCRLCEKDWPQSRLIPLLLLRNPFHILLTTRIGKRCL